MHLDSNNQQRVRTRYIHKAHHKIHQTPSMTQTDTVTCLQEGMHSAASNKIPGQTGMLAKQWHRLKVVYFSSAWCD